MRWGCWKVYKAVWEFVNSHFKYGRAELLLSLHWTDLFLCLSSSEQRSPVRSPLSRMPAALPDLEHGERVSVSENESHSWNAGPLFDCLPPLIVLSLSPEAPTDICASVWNACLCALFLKKIRVKQVALDRKEFTRHTPNFPAPSLVVWCCCCKDLFGVGWSSCRLLLHICEDPLTEVKNTFFFLKYSCLLEFGWSIIFSSRTPLTEMAKLCILYSRLVDQI